MAVFENIRRVKLDNLSATQKFAEDIAIILNIGDCICLSGDLGAGKTTLTRAIIRAIAQNLHLEVPSPTFTLVQQYDLRLPIGHLDLYRASDPDEVFELGLDDILTNGAAFIEWPDIIKDELPADCIFFEMTGLEDTRETSVSGPKNFIDRLDRTLLVREFLDANGYEQASRAHLQGDMSYRQYERISFVDSPDQIFMNSPAIKTSPIIRDGKTYFDLAHLAQNLNPFIKIAHFLEKIELRAPKLYEFDVEKGFLLLEDLGSETPLDHHNVPISERYIASMDVLIHLHNQAIPEWLDDGVAQPYQIPIYDQNVMELEVSLLPDWYWEHKTNTQIDENTKQSYFKIWRDLIIKLDGSETSLVLRDFHSPNIIWQEGASDLERVGIIDFQDAQIGPSAYDVASLALDARVSVSADLEKQLLEHYKLHRLKQNTEFDIHAFDKAYAIMAAQRLCKVLGICIRMKKRDGNPNYLRLIPQLERYLIRTMSHLELEPLRNWFEEAGIFQSES